MVNILSTTEAMDILRLDPSGNYPLLGILLPAVDASLKTATGRDWSTDTEIDPLAKAGAQMLLVQWYENPAMVGSVSELEYGLGNVIGQLQAKALLLAEAEDAV